MKAYESVWKAYESIWKAYENHMKIIWKRRKAYKSIQKHESIKGMKVYESP